MDVRPNLLRPTARDLSKGIAFQLGPLTVDPPIRSVSAGSKSEMIEPRVMRVLIALADARGAVLSRDDLITECWDGVIVGDNAIARVISQLRRVVGDLAGDRVRVETIARVGFRLLVEDGPVDEETPAPLPVTAAPAPSLPAVSRMSRRTLALGGLGAAGLIGAGAFAGRGALFSHRPDPRAIDLWKRGQTIFRNAEPGGTRAATALYKQAVAIDPDYADAWGALAMCYHHALLGFSNEDRAGFRQLIDSSAKRAIQLDPRQPDANMALVLGKLAWGRWEENLALLRDAVRRLPDYWFAHAKLGMMLRDVGMIRQSIPYSRRTLEIDPALPIGWSFLAAAQAMAGDLQQADLTLDQAATRWPAHGALWWTRLNILLGSGRFGFAAAFARDPRSLPDYIPAGLGEFYAQIADALKLGDKPQIARSIEGVRQKLAQEPAAAHEYAPLLATLGANDLAFGTLEAFVARANADPPSAVAPAAVVLFEPPVLALRADPRYARLLEASGLEAYWKRSGSQPDFRRS